jgi:outer membrane protein OmpA-like peptidoglycan-associated protein
MKNFAIALIATGMMVPACASRKAAQQEVVNPLPAFADWEPQRAPLLEDEETTQQVAERENLQGPMASVVIVAVPGQVTPQFRPVYFGFGSARLDPADAEQLAESAGWLRDNPEQQVLIEGHTDASGPSQYNLALGEQRAAAVRDYLIQLGVDEERLQIVSRGEAEPASAQADRNRRSEVVPLPDDQQ